MMDPTRALDKIYQIVNSFHAAGFLYSARDEEKMALALKEEHMTPNRNLMQFFTYDHLPPHLQDISRPFATLAREIVMLLPDNPEKTVTLRKLLEAKDCAVRAKLFKQEDGT